MLAPGSSDSLYVRTVRPAFEISVNRLSPGTLWLVPFVGVVLHVLPAVALKPARWALSIGGSAPVAGSGWPSEAVPPGKATSCGALAPAAPQPNQLSSVMPQSSAPPIAV